MVYLIKCASEESLETLRKPITRPNDTRPVSVKKFFHSVLPVIGESFTGAVITLKPKSCAINFDRNS